MQNVRKVLLVICITAFMFSIFSTGCTNQSNQAQTSSAATGAATASQTSEESWQKEIKGSGGLKLPLAKEKIQYTWMLEEHPNYSVSENWAFFKKIEELTNVDIVFQPIASASYEDKKKVVIATRDLPDIMAMSRIEALQFGVEGAFYTLNDVIDKSCPNLKRIFEEHPQMKSGSMTADGKIYGFPQLSTDELFPFVGWMYRKDVFTANNIKIPETDLEFYDALKKLKELYPDSYPFVFRLWDGDGQVMSKFSSNYGVYGYTHQLIEYHNDSGQIAFMPSLPVFKQMVEFANKLYAEGLMDPNYPITTKQQVDQYMITGKAFVCNDWLNRVLQYNNKAKAAEKPIEGYEMAAYEPWRPAGGKGWVENNGVLGLSVNVLNARIKSPEVAAQFFDFLYSEAGTELTYWGVEGDTFVFNDKGGHRYTEKVEAIYNKNPDAKPKSTYGLSYNNIQIFQYISPNDEEASSPELMDYFARVRADNRIAPSPYYYNETEAEAGVWKDNYEKVKAHYIENIDKFVIGKRPMSEWDAFIAEFDSLGLQQLIDIRKAQHERATK